MQAMSKTSKILLGVGLALIAATLAIVFLVGPMRASSFYPALCGIEIAEAVFFGGLIVLEESSGRFDRLFTRIGCTTILSVCCIAAFLVSLFFMLVPETSLSWFIAIQIAIATILIVGFIVFYFIGARFVSDDRALLSNATSGIDRANQLQQLALKCEDTSVRKILERASDGIRSSDNTSEMGIAIKIDQKIAALSAAVGQEWSDQSAIKERAAEIMELIDEKKNQEAALKRGGF